MTSWPIPSDVRLLGLSFDAGAWTGRVLSAPALVEGSLPVQEQLIVEFYSR